MEQTLQEVWAKHIATYQASGQTMKVWCAEQNLTVHQLKYWLYKAQNRQNQARSTTFRAVAITPEPVHESVWVQVGSARIGIRPGFEPQLLRDVVAALGSEC